jgi:chorismate mutase / prephenate dehydratase
MNDGQNALEAIRRDIDEIDGKLLGLLADRFAATARVKTAKGGAIEATPMRPGREAAILRRLCEMEAPDVPAALRAAIWRAIISTSTLAQAPVRIHAASGLFDSIDARLLIAAHFGATPMERHPGDDAALSALARNTADMAIMPLDGGWAGSFLEGKAGKASVSGVLPLFATGAPPQFAVLSHAAAEQTGADETLVATNGQLPRDFAPAPLWQIQQGRLRVSCLPGFLDAHANPLLGVMRANGTLGLKVLGRYPSPIEIRP